MIFNVASHLLVLANGTHATTAGCVQKFQHQRFKRPGGLLVEADSKGPKTNMTGPKISAPDPKMVCCF